MAKRQQETKTERNWENKGLPRQPKDKPKNDKESNK